MSFYQELINLSSRPAPWYAADTGALWRDPHVARQMLRYHLDPQVDAASRNHAFIRKSVAWLTERFAIGPGTKIADFGCGPGLYTLPLAQAGAGVTGIDFSESSLAHARTAAAEAGAEVSYVEADYLAFETGERFDLILMIMCDYCAQPPENRGRLLDRFRCFLAPGGSVVLDVYTPAWFRQQRESAGYERNFMDGFWSAADSFTFHTTWVYPEEMVTLARYTVVEPDRTRTVHNWLQAFRPEDLAREFAEHGLVVNEWLGDVAGGRYDPESAEMAVAAGKA